MTQVSSFHGNSPVALLVDKLTGQRDRYQQLKQLADQQATLIAEGATEQLLAVLAQRQQLVDELSRLSADITPYRDRWAQISASIDVDDRRRVNGLIEEVEGLLEAIIEQDDRDREQLQTAREQVGKQIKRTHHAGRAMNAYRAAPTAAAARFTDRRG